MSWKKVIGSLAPTIGTMLGGPLAGGAMKALADGLLGEDVPEDKLEQELEKAITNASPETLARIKEIDANYKLEIERLKLKPEELVYSDKHSARDMQKENKSNVPALLAFLLTFGFFGCLTALFYVEIPEANKPIVYSMLGMLGTVWLGAMQFWHGTTKGSADKNLMFEKLQQNA